MYTIEVKGKYGSVDYLSCTDEEKSTVNMDDLRKVHKECEGDVYTLRAFMEEIDNGIVSSYDGVGYFHDGKHRTNVKVWNNDLTWNDVKDYPYVCWYNK